MSALAGVWNFDGQPVDRKLLKDFSESLKGQGPDGESIYLSGSIGMLHRSFHTTSDSHREKQPYFSRKGFILIWDGRLDNRDELKVELQRDLDAAPTDVAIVAAACDRWEGNCFRRLIGDWAVSVWNPQQRELIFSVDYMAIRHIFYYIRRNSVWWSTDLTPLVLMSGERLHIDDLYIAGYFANDPDAHLTPYREICEVPPGQVVHIRNGKEAIERHWQFSPSSRIRYKTDAEYEEHFRHLFRQSVRRRLRSDCPILAELSGGLDSSSIVCMADDILSKESNLTPRVDTLSFYDKTEPHGDDWVYFHKIEEKRGRSGTHIDASELGNFPSSLAYRDFVPLPGSLGITSKLELARASAMQNGGYRVVLSGTGGDEFLGGIPNPSSHLADLVMQFELITLARQLVAWSLVKRRPWIQLLWQAILELLPPSIAQHFIDYAKIEAWIEPEFAKRTRIAVRKLDVEDHFGLWLPSRRAYIGGVVLMANKLAKHLSSKLAPEESRYPYLDQTLIEFILSIPATQLLRPGERRSLMRRALVGIVPQEILARRTKQFGARTPIVALEKNLEELQRAFVCPVSSRLKYVNRDCFLEALQAARNGKEVHLVRLLKTASLEFWLRDLVSHSLIDSTTVPAVPAVPVSLKMTA